MLRRFTLKDTRDRTVWGFARPRPGRGDLDPLRTDPVWGPLLPVCSGRVMTDALHGRVGPLLEQTRSGSDSLRVLAQTLPDPLCAERTRCGSYRERDCRPGRKVPACFVPIGTAPDRIPLAQEIIQAWREGFRVLEVSEGEFVPGLSDSELP